MAGPAAKIGWKVVASLTGVGTTLVARKVLNALWVKTKGGAPPVNPEQRDTSWTEALTWTVASTAGIAVARVLTARLAAGAWERATGSLPPGLETPPENATA